MGKPEFKRSYHCVIREDGLRCTMVPDEDVAWHAGSSAFAGRSRCNDFMLGVSFAGGLPGRRSPPSRSPPPWSG